VRSHMARNVVARSEMRHHSETPQGIYLNEFQLSSRGSPGTISGGQNLNWNGRTYYMGFTRNLQLIGSTERNMHPILPMYKLTKINLGFSSAPITTVVLGQ